MMDHRHMLLLCAFLLVANTAQAAPVSLPQPTLGQHQEVVPFTHSGRNSIDASPSQEEEFRGSGVLRSAPIRKRRFTFPSDVATTSQMHKENLSPRAPQQTEEGNRSSTGPIASSASDRSIKGKLVISEDASDEEQRDTEEHKHSEGDSTIRGGSATTSEAWHDEAGAPGNLSAAENEEKTIDVSRDSKWDLTGNNWEGDGGSYHGPPKPEEIHHDPQHAEGLRNVPQKVLDLHGVKYIPAHCLDDPQFGDGSEDDISPFGDDDCRQFTQIVERHPRLFWKSAVGTSCLILVILFAIGTS